MAFLKSPERNWLIASFGLLTLCLGLSSFVSYQNANQLIENSHKSQETFEVIKNLDEVFASITIAESARRGYIYLENRKELERFYDAVEEIPPNLQELRQHFLHYPDQLYRFNDLERLTSQRVALLKESIKLRNQPSSSEKISQLILTNRSIAFREQIQRVIAELQEAEKAELKRSVEASQESIKNRKIIEIWLMLSGFIVISSCFIALYLQLAKRQEAETLQHKFAQQKELSELKLKFFSMVSHEFRTPLSIILGSAQLLIEGQPTWNEERKSKNLRRIQSSAKVMKQLLTDILTLTRAEAGKLDCNLDDVDLESFCLNLVEDFEFSSPANHQIYFISECYFPYACLDERLLYSILSNLLSNAIKYSPDRSKVQLILTCDATTVTFQVKDEGIGISVEDQNQLFDPFYRGQNSTQIAGTGLGLAVVKKCVDLHQGEITIESQLGVGTTFKVTLPRHCVSYASAE
jgi:signal transduction histidine kinase